MSKTKQEYGKVENKILKSIKLVYVFTKTCENPFYHYYKWVTVYSFYDAIEQLYDNCLMSLLADYLLPKSKVSYWGLN